MAIIENLYTGDGTTVLFPFSFSYLDQQDVKVTVNSTLTTDFTFANDSTVEFNTAPANGAFIRIFRETPIDQAKATFFAGSAIRASDLNQNNTQLVFSAQEVLGRAVNRLGDVMAGILNMGGFKITNLATPTNAGDAVTKAFVDAAVAAGISDGNKGDVTVSGNGGTWTVNDGSITSSKILDGTIVDGDVSASAALAYSKLALAGSVVDADVNASAAIAGTKISPDFGSQNVVTTGTTTAASLNPTGSSVPTNGIYLPSANNVAISTDGSEQMRLDSSGNVGIGTTSPSSKLHLVGNFFLDGNLTGWALDWQSFTGASITQGGGNLSIAHYWYAQIGKTVILSIAIEAGSGGGSSSDEIQVNLPVNFASLSAVPRSGGGGYWQPSGTAANRAPAAPVFGLTDQILRFYKTSGSIAGTDLSTTNGKIGVVVVYNTA